MELSDKRMEALRAVADALIPGIEPVDGDGDPGAASYRLRASDLRVAEQVPAVLERLTPAERREFARLLDLLASPLLGLTWAGPLRPIDRLSPAQRERLLERWSRSPIGVLRKSFRALKRLIGFLFYGGSDGAGNPVWQGMGYPGPLPDVVPAEPSVTPWSLSGGEEIACDVVVVGSGAGGGLAAGLLAEAGQEVVLVDKGPYLPESELNQREAEMVGRLYERAGALTSADGGVSIFAGSCLGGGTTINWSGSFATPEAILGEWAERLALPELTGASFRRSLEAVQEAVGVTTAESPDNPQNAALRRGSEALGHRVDVVPRNVRGCTADECRGCGYCGLGCRRGSKRGTLRSWIPRATAAGARVLPDTEVERILVEAGRVTGVETVTQGADGAPRRRIFRAPRVVVAAGSIHTPALLMRSGLTHPHLGRHLHLHPTVAVSARYDDPIDPWWGTMMSAVNNQFTDLDGHYGFKIETPPAHPGLMAMALPWVSGRQFKEDMLSMRRVGSFIILLRDRFGGRVTVDRDGYPVVRYRVHRYDRMHMIRGIAEGARIHRRAGAEEILLPHATLPRIPRSAGEDALEDSLRGLLDLPWKPNTFPLFSAHQMATCRMGGRAEEAPLAPDGSFRGTEGLWVADGSALPSASGVNPMITIQALAHHTISGLVAGL